MVFTKQKSIVSRCNQTLKVTKFWSQNFSQKNLVTQYFVTTVTNVATVTTDIIVTTVTTVANVTNVTTVTTVS